MNAMAAPQSFSEYKIIEPLYESNSSIVNRVIRSGNQQPFILKQLNKEYPTLLDLARFRTEYKIMQRLEVEGVSQVYDIEKHQSSLAFFFGRYRRKIPGSYFPLSGD